MKYSNWSEFKERQLSKNFSSELLNLSFQILKETKEDLTGEIVQVKFVETGFTLNVDKEFNPRRTVFSYFKFNKNSFIIETLYSGKRSKNAKYRVKKNHVVNQFKITNESDYTSEVREFIKEAFDVIKGNKYDLIHKPKE